MFCLKRLTWRFNECVYVFLSWLYFVFNKYRFFSILEWICSSFFVTVFSEYVSTRVCVIWCECDCAFLFVCSVRMCQKLSVLVF